MQEEGSRHGSQPTLRTVAELAGVHVSTVSKILSPSLRPGTRVASRETFERVQKIAESIGFTPNPLAAGLRKKRTSLVGVLVPRLTDIVLATMYEGIQSAAQRYDYQTFVNSTNDEQSNRVKGVQTMFDRRVDGLILGDATIDTTFVDSLSTRETPFVLVSRKSGSHPSVTCDDYEGGRLAAEHLLALGHRRLGVIAGQPYASTGVERTRGFVDACATAGVYVDPAVIVESRFSAKGGHTAAQEILGRTQPPTGIFAVNDFAAIGAMGAARSRGLSVGRDLAVVGFNDTQLAAELPIPLTSVHSPMRHMGEAAFEMLHDLMEGKPIESVVFAPTLTVRESSSYAVTA